MPLDGLPHSSSNSDAACRRVLRTRDGQSNGLRANTIGTSHSVEVVLRSQFTLWSRVAPICSPRSVAASVLIGGLIRATGLGSMGHADADSSSAGLGSGGGRTVRTPRLDAAGDPRFAVLALQRAAGNRATVAALRGRVGGGPAVLARDKKPAKVCDSPG